MENMLKIICSDVGIDFNLSENKRMLDIRNGIDPEYPHNLFSKAQAQKLIDELQELVNQMEG